MPKASLLVGHVHALDRFRVARGALLHMTCVHSHLPVSSHVCVVWPACIPHCVARMQASRCRACWRSRLHLRPRGLLARAQAQAVHLPSAPIPEPAVRAHAFPAGLPAGRPSRLSLLGGAARLVALPVRPSCRRYAPKTRDPARAGATAGRCLPAVHACQAWGLGVQHRCRKLDDCPRFHLRFWVVPERRFFSRFREDLASSGPSE
jgi:hypothetical protein